MGGNRINSYSILEDCNIIRNTKNKSEDQMLDIIIANKKCLKCSNHIMCVYHFSKQVEDILFDNIDVDKSISLLSNN